MGPSEVGLVSAGGGGGGGGGVPTELLRLVPFVGTLVAVASNPVGWASSNLADWVRELVANWVVGGVIDATQFVLGWVLFGAERIASIVLEASGPLRSPFTILGDASVSAITGLYAAVRGVAASAGLAGPVASTVAVVVLVSLVLAVGVAVLSVVPGSDAFGAAKGVLTRE